MTKKKRSAVGLGTVGDSFYLAEEYLDKVGENIGLKERRNQLLKTERALAKKLHKSNSGLRRLLRFRKAYKRKAYLDTTLKKIRGRLE